jgi:transposase
MSYGKEMRRLVVTFVRSGASKAEAARRFGIARSRVYVWLEGGGTGKPGPKQGHKLDEERLRKAIAARPDAMLKELARELEVRESTVHYGLKRLGISRKKNVALR